MGKLLKVLLYGIGGIVVLLVIAAVVIPMVIDPNDYKGQITQVVKDRTGRDLTIGGDIALSIFPWLALDIAEVDFSNAPGFGDDPFARVKQVSVGIKLLPLLRKQVEMSTLELDGLSLSLARKTDGTTNWDDLVAAEAPAQPATETEAESGSGMPLAALAIGGVEIVDAQLLWDDQQSGARYEVSDLDLTLGEIAPGSPVDFNLAAQFISAAPPVKSVIELGGVVSISDDLQQISVRDFSAGVNATGESLPGGELAAELKSRLSIDLQKQTLDLPELVLNAMGITFRGDAAGTGITGDAPRFTGNLSVDEFAPRDVMQALAMELPDVSDPDVLGKADMQLAFAAGLNDVKVSSILLHLDDSTIDGNAAVQNFASPVIRFAFALDEIDVDRYLPPQTEGVAPTPAEAAAGGATALPVDTLRALNLDGSLKIGKLKAYQLRSSDITVQIKAKDGLLRVHPASANMYEGSYKGDVSLDVRQDKARISMDESLQGIQAGPLLKDLTGDDKLRGTGNVSAKLNAIGVTPDEFRKTLNGNAAFSFTDGALKGVNIISLIRKAKSAVKGKPRPAQEGADETEFTELSGSAKITNGLIRNDDLTAMSPLLRVGGAGTADLVSEKIDYLVTTKIVGSLEGQGGKELGELKGVEIPVRVTGTFSAPSYKVDLQKVLEGEAKQKIEKHTDKLEEKLQKKLGDDVGDKLKGLFGN